MREVLGEHEDTGVDAELMLGGPSEVLLRVSEDAQLVGLGSHGRGRLATAVLGSVARYCVQHTGCPVVVIPPRLLDRGARGGTEHRFHGRR